MGDVGTSYSVERAGITRDRSYGQTIGNTFEQSVGPFIDNEGSDGMISSRNSSPLCRSRRASRQKRLALPRKDTAFLFSF